MPELKSCRVSFTDLEGIEHATTVCAESLLEAAALGIKALSVAESPVGTAATLKIQIYQPIAEHAVRVSRVQSWLQSGSKSPKEAALKSRLRELFGGSS